MEKKNFWNEAAKYGVIMALVASSLQFPLAFAQDLRPVARQVHDRRGDVVADASVRNTA